MTTTESNGTALAVREYTKLAEVTGFSSAQINLVRQTVAPGASIVELAWYLYNAKRLGLEPTLDQIYLIRYAPNGPAEIVIGINGYRAQAESSGAYAGSDDAVFEYEDGKLSKATVTVWKIVQGMRVPFTASVRWDEFYPGDGKAGEQYRKRPHNQLAVRAESHALRKAFPYQTGRLEAEPAPPMWIEAAQADESAHHTPALSTARSNKYVQVYGDDEHGTAYDLPEHPQTRAAPPRQAPARSGRAADGSPPEAAPPEPTTVTRKDDPLWVRWLDAERRARAADVDMDTGVVKLGHVTNVALEASIAELEGMIREQTADEAAQQSALPT